VGWWVGMEWWEWSGGDGMVGMEWWEWNGGDGMVGWNSGTESLDGIEGRNRGMEWWDIRVNNSSLLFCKLKGSLKSPFVFVH
jgi:hypothetical protein